MILMIIYNNLLLIIIFFLFFSKKIKTLILLFSFSVFFFDKEKLILTKNEKFLRNINKQDIKLHQLLILYAIVIFQGQIEQLSKK